MEVTVSTLKKQPTRKCVGCGEIKNKKELIRVIKTNENEFFVDTTGKANGRGAYICNDKDCFLKARKCKGLERSFKMSINNEIYEALAKEFDGLEK